MCVQWRMAVLAWAMYDVLCGLYRARSLAPNHADGAAAPLLVPSDDVEPILSHVLSTFVDIVPQCALPRHPPRPFQPPHARLTLVAGIHPHPRTHAPTQSSSLCARC